MAHFELVSKFKPQGDQPQAIEELIQGIRRGERHQTLLGATGTGKTFTMANVIASCGLPTLIMSHNKTLAAQLYGEFKGFFPQNAVEYFTSYYDYYQPEAYVVPTDTYIEKDASINDEIDRLRLRATSSLLEREDVIIVSSVSCIYGLGSPEEYKNMLCSIRCGPEPGENIRERDDLLKKLIDIQYARNDFDFDRGVFRVRGDVVEVHLAYEDVAVRIEFFGDEVDSISKVNLITGEVIEEKERIVIFPAKHFVTTQPRLDQAVITIEKELNKRLTELENSGKLLEAQRLRQRTRFDLEMLREVGYCSGIENYSRHIDGREPGTRPACLLDYFPDKFLLILDESHITVPQVGGMYAGDRSRKQTLVDFGFRLPSALDNRPLKFDEFERFVYKAIYVSATPADYELEKSGGVFVEQIIRPTGLLDPEIDVRPVTGQIDNLIGEINDRVSVRARTLVTTLTKRMAEDLTEYLDKMGIRVRYLHSDIDTLQRVEILRSLRLGDFDVLVGINLLREGLDLPEVSLVAILDADKQGFLRSERSLVQTIGRASRNVHGKVIMYADKITTGMRNAIDETNRRRKIQVSYNKKHNITPRTIQKDVADLQMRSIGSTRGRSDEGSVLAEKSLQYFEDLDFDARGQALEKAMKDAAKDMDFEKAALLRDQLFDLKAQRDQNSDDQERPWEKGSRGNSLYPSLSEKKAKSRRQARNRSRNLKKK
ncbi:MAG: excinuclease ABC subunit B [Candidatus Cloacimonetes bacterium 4572_55]|nr:MAG: excinuclease ABC subunit B [Candidatus Cloacimonetes bacterium 4572_55]